MAAVAAALLTSSCHGPAHSQSGPAARATYTIDTPLRILVQNERARAIVNRYAPGITEGAHYYMTAPFSLRQLRSMLHGQITEAELAQMARELAQIR
jgi:hypothetical protein